MRVLCDACIARLSVAPRAFRTRRARGRHVGRSPGSRRCLAAALRGRSRGFSLELAGTEDWQQVNWIRPVLCDGHRVFECSACGKRLQCVAYCHEHVRSKHHWRRLEWAYPSLRFGLVSLRACPEHIVPTVVVASPGLPVAAPGLARSPDVVALEDALEASGSEDSDHFTAERIARDPWDRGRFASLRGLSPGRVGSQPPAEARACGSACGFRSGFVGSEPLASVAGPGCPPGVLLDGPGCSRSRGSIAEPPMSPAPRPRAQLQLDAPSHALGDSPLPSLAPPAASSPAPRRRPERRSVTFELPTSPEDPVAVSRGGDEVLEEF